jgi:hypothetical protein
MDIVGVNLLGENINIIKKKADIVYKNAKPHLDASKKVV